MLSAQETLDALKLFSEFGCEGVILFPLRPYSFEDKPRAPSWHCSLTYKNPVDKTEIKISREGSTPNEAVGAALSLFQDLCSIKAVVPPLATSPAARTRL